MDTVLIKPSITEKSMSDAQSGKFTFIVDKKAHKDEIKKAVESQFKVHAVSISTSIVKGKSKRAGTKRQIVKQPPFKKAIVELLKGEKIDLFDLKSSAKK